MNWWIGGWIVESLKGGNRIDKTVGCWWIGLVVFGRYRTEGRWVDL